MKKENVSSDSSTYWRRNIRNSFHTNCVIFLLWIWRFETRLQGMSTIATIHSNQCGQIWLGPTDIKELFTRCDFHSDSFIITNGLHRNLVSLLQLYPCEHLQWYHLEPFVVIIIAIATAPCEQPFSTSIWLEF